MLYQKSSIPREGGEARGAKNTQVRGDSSDISLDTRESGRRKGSGLAGRGGGVPLDRRGGDSNETGKGGVPSPEEMKSQGDLLDFSVKGRIILIKKGRKRLILRKEVREGGGASKEQRRPGGAGVLNMVGTRTRKETRACQRATDCGLGPERIPKVLPIVRKPSGGKIGVPRKKRLLKKK